MNYKPNEIDWDILDFVIHDADEKSESMLRCVLETGRADGLIKTIYVNKKGDEYHFDPKELLHDPDRFCIVVDRCFECEKQAEWSAEWSDRCMIVCEDHRKCAQEAHDLDHSYDQTGIKWTKIIYNTEVEMSISDKEKL